MDQRSQVESYLLEILARVRSAMERCNSLLSSDYISESPRDLAKTLSKICDYLGRAAVAIFSEIDWDDADSVEPDLLRLRSADALVQQWTPHLRYVQGSRTDRLPWGIVPAFENLVRRLIPDKQVLLRPKWNYNYSVTLSDFRSVYIKGLEEFVDDLPDVSLENDVLADLQHPFHVVAFPSLERENILLHTLLGHELGHLFADLFLTDARKDVFRQSVIAPVEEITKLQLQREGFTKSGTLFYEEVLKLRIAYNAELALEYWIRGIEELLSDAFGAILFGPAALFSTLEMAIQHEYDVPPSPETNFYPPWRMRLREVLAVVEDAERFFPVPESLFKEHGGKSRAKLLNEKFEAVQEICKDRSDFAGITSQIGQLAYARLENSLHDGVRFLLDECKLRKHRAVPQRVYKNIHTLIGRLDHDLPPSALESTINDRVPVSLVEIINASWFHRASLPARVLAENGHLDENIIEGRKRANRLTLKAIEFADLSREFWKAQKVQKFVVAAESRSALDSSRFSEALSLPEIVASMEEKDLGRRLVVTPLLNPGESLGYAAIDLRLGNQFIVMKRETFPLLDVGEVASIDREIERYQEKIVKPYGQSFILHPRQLVIGSTLEYIQLPPDLICYVIGKSTWGRMGLIIATATKVDPGFRGCITLEIINEGEVPLVLYPGLPIAQIVLHRVSGASSYKGAYSCAIGPEFPKFGSKKQSWQYWTRRKR